MPRPLWIQCVSESVAGDSALCEVAVGVGCGSEVELSKKKERRDDRFFFQHKLNKQRLSFCQLFMRWSEM